MTHDAPSLLVSTAKQLCYATQRSINDKSVAISLRRPTLLRTTYGSLQPQKFPTADLTLWLHLYGDDEVTLTLFTSHAPVSPAVWWLNDTPDSKSVHEEVNRKLPTRNTTVQLLTVYTNPEHHNAQRYLRTDRQTDRRTDRRSYRVTIGYTIG